MWWSNRLAAAVMVVGWVLCLPSGAARAGEGTAGDRGWPAIDRGTWKGVDQPGLAEALKNAPPLKVEEVVDGPQAVWPKEPWFCPNPDGKSWDVLLMYYRHYTGPHEAYWLDTGTGQVTKREIAEDPDRFIFHLVPTMLLNGKMYIKPLSAGGKVGIWVYDPATNHMEFKGYPLADKAKLDEGGGWVLGADGAIWGAGSAGDRVSVYRVDPNTFEGQVFEPFGRAQKRTWLYSRLWGHADWIYVAVGHSPWQLLGFNTKTKEGKVLAETENIIGDHATIGFAAVDPATGGGFVVSIQQPKGSGKERVNYDLRDGVLKERPGPAEKVQGWRAPPTDEEARRVPQPEVRTTPPDANGVIRVWYRNASWEQDVKDPKKRRVVYADWKKAQITVKRYPEKIRRMEVLADGRIFALGESYAEAVLLDPAKKTRQALGRTMSVYSMTQANGIVYMCGYPSSQVWVYDPARPWTMNVASEKDDQPPVVEKEDGPTLLSNKTNPRVVAILKEHTKVHMPYGGAVAAADGRVYFGGKIIRIGNGGGLGWWDPKSETAGGLWEPFSAYQVFWMCSAKQGRYVLCSTKPVEDDLKRGSTPGQGKLFVWDTQTHKMVHEIADARLGPTFGPIQEVADGLVMGFATARGDDPKGEQGGRGVLYGLDVEAGKVVWNKEVPVRPITAFASVRRWAYAFHRGPDGHVWAWFDKVLVRIAPADGKVEIVGRLEKGDVGVLAFGPGGEVYLAGAERLRRVVR